VSRPDHTTGCCKIHTDRNGTLSCDPLSHNDILSSLNGVDGCVDMSHRYLVLGLLAEMPMTGYDIKKHVKATLSAVTNASYGTLYPTLHKLLKEGAVEMREIPQRGRPSKKVYSITSSGQAELKSWLKEPAAEDQVKREFLLKLYLSDNLPEEHVRALISSRRGEIEKRLKSLREKRDSLKSQKQALVVDYALSIYQAEIDWLAQLEDKLGVA